MKHLCGHTVECPREFMAVEAGISTFEEEFLAHILLPDNQTVGQWVGPQLAQVYETQQMPALLPGLTARELPPAEQS